MPSSDPDRHVVEIEGLLRSVASIVKKRGRDILGSFAITPPQLEALLVLREGGELTMGELCHKMYLACSTATDLVDRMERNGLIERVRESTDRRVVRLRVLEKGAAIIDEVMAARRSYLSTVLAGMDTADKQRLIHALTQLNALMTREVH